MRDSSYLQADGVARMDASIMTGDGRAGAVAQVPGLRHPSGWLATCWSRMPMSCSAARRRRNSA